MFRQCFFRSQKFEYFLVESDSNDKSLVELEKLNKRSNFSYISLGKLKKKEFPNKNRKISLRRK